jgi:phosphopantothenoylcysteine decarboxylase/phosphopantothenate--cysteine ligase
MNVNMLEHEATQANIEQLRKRGAAFVEPEEGELACGWKGAGRLASPWEIFYHVRKVLSQQDFAGKRILITSGPTREALDPVRFISNRSSGKMGVWLAREAFVRGAEVTLIHGPITSRVPAPIKMVPVISANDMCEAVISSAFCGQTPPDIVIMAAAVADFRTKAFSEKKLKKDIDQMTLELLRNPDILTELGHKRGERAQPKLVGFAVETGEIEELLEQLKKKLTAKQADLMVGNFAQDALELDTNRVWLMTRDGNFSEVSTTYKSRVANKILDAVLKL